MKTKIIAAFAVIAASVSIALAAGPVVSPIVDTTVNPLTVAEALVRNPWKTLQCNLSCEMLISNQFKPTQMDFTMVKDSNEDLVITSLTVNNIIIPMPEPIYGIPLGDGGMMRNLFLNINAVNAAGEYACNGYVQKDIVLKGDSLVAELAPASLRQEIPIDPTLYGQGIQLVIENFNFGYGWGWDGTDGKFYIYLPPVSYARDYVLRNMSTGSIVGSGIIEPFHPVAPANDAYVGIKYVGNVSGAEFPGSASQESWTQLPAITFDCLVPMTNGTKVWGKVCFVDVGYGGVEVSGFGAFDVYVQRATGNGDMPFVPLANRSTADQWGYYSSFNTTGFNVGKVVVTIIPKPINTVTNPWIGLHRFFTVPSGSPIVGNGS